MGEEGEGDLDGTASRGSHDLQEERQHVLLTKKTIQRNEFE